MASKRTRKNPNGITPQTPDVVSAPLAAAAPPAPAAAPAAEAPRADRMGVELRRARNTMGLTPRQCEDVLRIKEEYLLALENGHYHLLPTTAHAKGFLRTYAQYLGLGAQLNDLQSRLIEETQGLPLSPQLVMPAALPEAKLPTHKFILIGVVAAILLAIIYASISAPPAPEVAPALPEAEKPVADAPLVPTEPAMSLAPTAEEAPALVAETPALEPAVNAQEVPPPNKNGVSIRAADDVWIQVQDKMGATIFSRLLKKGEEIPAPAGDGLTLTAGNGAGIQLVLNGSVTRPVGNKAEVVKGISLDAKNIAARLKAPAKPKPAPKPLATIESPAAVTVPDAPPAVETEAVEE